MQLTQPCSIISASLLSLGILSGCSSSGQEVRVALCQDMTTIALGKAPTWRGTDIQLQGYQDAVILVRFATDNGEGRAECHYPHLKGEDTAITLATPIEAYSTSPSRLVINGRSLTGPDLARVMEEALKKQGREFLDRVKDSVRGQ